MKKNNNIKQLKKWMINRSTDSIRCRIYGVQAYGISKQEYNVIVEFAKQGGRYYFIDRDGNRFLASRYEDAERVAGEIIENVQAAFNVAIDLTREFMTTSKVDVDSELIDLFLELCDVSGLEYESRKFNVTDDGECFTTYILKGGIIAPEQTAADEQDDEQDNEDNEGNENGENATVCEPSKLAGILAKVKGSARKVCEKAAFAMFVAVVGTVSLLALYFSVLGLGEFLEVLGIEGGTWTACAVSLLLFPTVILEFVLSVEQNLMAVIERLFPSFFEDWQRVDFAVPFTFWYRLIQESRK